MIKNAQAYLLTAASVDDPISGFRTFECDCACASSEFTPLRQINSDLKNIPIKKASLYEAALPSNHKLFFNPLNVSGVIVANEHATNLLTQYDKSHIPASNRSLEVEFLELGLVEPINAIPAKRVSKPSVLSVWLHVTNACNLACDYCYLNKTDEKLSLELGYESIDAIFRSAIAGGFNEVKIKYAGGEATLNLATVFEIDRYAREKAEEQGLNLDSVILSNGVAWSEHTIQQVQERNIRIMVSLDGVGKWHDAQRVFLNGMGSYEWVERSIDRMLQKGLQPFISITVTDRNVEGIKEAVQFVLKRKLPFNINFFRDNECASGFGNLRMRDETLIQNLKAAFAEIESDLPDFSLLGMLVDRSQFNQPHTKTCSVGEAYLVIDQHGKISKCHMEIENTITDIYAEDPLAIIRQDQHGLQNINVEEKEGCRDCEWRYWCSGGCPLLTYRATGRYDVKSPYCNVYKAIYPELLRLEGLRLMKLAGIQY